jgi:hypothetical protein
MAVWSLRLISCLIYSSTQHGPGPGLSLVAQIMFGPGPCLGLVAHIMFGPEPGLGLVAQIMLGPGPGLGLIAQIIFGSGPGANYSSQTLHKTFWAFSGYRFLAMKKLFVVAFILYSRHSWAPETNPTDLIFSGIFVAPLSQK